MLKPKRKSVNRERNTQFVAPYSLKKCQRRLRSKDDRKQRRWFDPPDTEVYVSRLNPETLEFYVVRGAIGVSGRLDMLDDDSTLVNFKSTVNWLSHFLHTAYVPVLLLGVLVIVYLLSFVFVLVSADLAVMFSDLMKFALNNLGLYLFGGSLPFIFYKHWIGRGELAREVYAILTDPMPDLPDLSDLDDAEDAADGELVAAPPMKSGSLFQELKLETLLKHQSRKPRRDGKRKTDPQN